ncbi:MAG: NAD-dependent deacylase [Anaerolinea sp.]|nr:NAD-dependent deacylase [Anaerolinea sp.]
MDDPIETLAYLVAQSRSMIAFTGAGISTPSGIPDFRSPHCGLWEGVDPLEVASIYGFRQNPEAFYGWVSPLARVILNAKPNPAHEALARLEQMGILKALITQNIDMLHGRAGNKTVHELHGHMREATCVSCFTVYAGEAIIERFLEDRVLPRCPKCGGVLKPNVILFGEQLPYRELQAAQEAARRTDLMLIVGSSLEVAPASDLPLIALRAGAKLIIVNYETTFVDPKAACVVHGNCAEVLPAVLERLEKTV